MPEDSKWMTTEVVMVPQGNQKRPNTNWAHQQAMAWEEQLGSQQRDVEEWYLADWDITQEMPTASQAVRGTHWESW